MNAKTLFGIFCCIFWLLSTSVIAQAQDALPSDEILERRRTLAESGKLLYQPQQQRSTSMIAATGNALAEAMDVDPTLLIDVAISGPDAASDVFPGIGVIRPKQGSTFAVLSSGMAGTSAPEPGTDFSPVNADGDKVTLTLLLDIPVGANRLSFSYNFLSAEVPEFVRAGFNDTFTVLLADSRDIREIARATVDSSEFIRVSATNASGSGFDIFTDDPTGVDVEFGGGLPDAGVTGFTFVNVPVTGGETIRLEFSVEDRGDGILDSAVILDDLQVSFLELVDPNTLNPNRTLLSNGNIISDSEKLAQGGEPRDAAAADGVTKLLLRNKVFEPGTVEFCLVNNAELKDGGLLPLGSGTDPTLCVTVPVTETSQGFMAFAIYQTPVNFNRGGDEASSVRLIEFSVRFTPTTGNVIESQIPFKLVRPPVLLVHGIWSSQNGWMAPVTFPLIFDGRAAVRIADYENTNASFFAVNRAVLRTFIDRTVISMRENDIAATQVDVVTHSMGGILSRNHVSRPDYRRNENFNAGDIHKLITMNTPHTGTPLANLAMDYIRDNPNRGALFANVMRQLGRPIEEGAVEDLAQGSLAINAITDTPVPSHVLIGTGGFEDPTLIPGDIGTLYRAIDLFEIADPREIFQGQQYDGIVGRASQEGGISNLAVTSFNGLDSIHCCVPEIGGVTSSFNYSNRVIELLNTPINDSVFAVFPAPSSIPNINLPSHTVVASSIFQADANGGLVIIFPPDGSVVNAGEVVHVVVEPDPEVTIDEMLIVGPGVAEGDNVAPFEFDVTIPIGKIGPFPISAVGRDSNSNFFTSTIITLQVTPLATLESITVVPRDAILSTIGESRNLGVLGIYSDGVVRDITSPTAGTEYLTSNPESIAVSPEGEITAVGSGSSTIVARNGTVQDSISVIVLLPNNDPIANAGPDQTVVVGSVVTLDGSSSFDPDNGPEPLSYEWLQIGGPPVTLENPTTASPVFTPLEVGTYIFSLIVRDGQADSVPDVVTIEVILPDLVVQKIIATDNNVQVVIQNQGAAPVPAENGFWVDVYIDPDPLPTKPNEIWNFLADEGLVWGVDGPVLPMEPGEVITLTIGDALYWPDLSKFSGSLPPETPIYAQVDSADTRTTYGGILESHEATGGPYNNIAGPVLVGASVFGEHLYLPLITDNATATSAASRNVISGTSSTEQDLIESVLPPRAQMEE